MHGGNARSSTASWCSRFCLRIEREKDYFCASSHKENILLFRTEWETQLIRSWTGLHGCRSTLDWPPTMIQGNILRIFPESHHNTLGENRSTVRCCLSWNPKLLILSRMRGEIQHEIANLFFDTMRSKTVTQSKQWATGCLLKPKYLVGFYVNSFPFRAPQQLKSPGEVVGVLGPLNPRCATAGRIG